MAALVALVQTANGATLGLEPSPDVVAKADDLILADGGKSEYRIVIAADASPSTQYAAKELQTFLKQISAAELPMVTDREAATGHEIVLGASSHLQSPGGLAHRPAAAGRRRLCDPHAWGRTW